MARVSEDESDDRQAGVLLTLEGFVLASEDVGSSRQDLLQGMGDGHGVVDAGHGIALCRVGSIGERGAWRLETAEWDREARGGGVGAGVTMERSVLHQVQLDRLRAVRVRLSV